jgi:hypothetical protein
MSWLITGVAVTLMQLVLAELFDWFPWIARRTVLRAAAMLPADQRRRYQEEWLAELVNLPGQRLSTLLWSLRILARAPSMRSALLGKLQVGAQLTKRILDVAISATVLWLFAPAILLIALGIKLGSRGPVFDRLLCVGRTNHGFMWLTFRTSRRNGRVTRVGRFLGVSGLGNLPQFVNVLRGHMSLVAPPPGCGDAERKDPIVHTKLAMIPWSGLHGNGSEAEWSLWIELGMILRALASLLAVRKPEDR